MFSNYIAKHQDQRISLKLYFLIFVTHYSVFQIQFYLSDSGVTQKKGSFIKYS